MGKSGKNESLVCPVTQKPCLSTCTEATLDIETVVEEAFSGEIGFTGLLACVSDTAILRFLQMVGGQSFVPIDPLLKQLCVGRFYRVCWRTKTAV